MANHKIIKVPEQQAQTCMGCCYKDIEACPSEKLKICQESPYIFKKIFLKDTLKLL